MEINDTDARFLLHLLTEKYSLQAEDVIYLQDIENMTASFAGKAINVINALQFCVDRGWLSHETTGYRILLAGTQTSM